MVSPLLTPTSYLRIQNKYVKRYSYVYPAIITFVICILSLALPEKLNILQENGFVKSVNSLLSVLVAFYIASLAAIATFKNELLDKNFSGTPVKLKVLIKGKTEDKPLNRRQFLCYLFGYAAFIAMFIFIMGEMSFLLKDNFIYLAGMVDNFILNLKIPILSAFKLTTTVVYFSIISYVFLLSNLITTTLLGLHYLTDRIHRP